MLRFAPSSTCDINVGHLRIALFNYIVSKLKDESFVVRIEDIDKKSIIEGKDQEILDILGLFGIEYREVVYQSSYLKYHRAMALQLLHDKRAFNCFCTPETILDKRKKAQMLKIEYRYDGTCENLRADMTIDNPNPFVIRLKNPQESFIIMTQDKEPTHDFASGVDDMIGDISTVVCDKEYLNNTAKQTAIRKALGYDKEIEYLYLPNILNSDKFNIKSLLEEGFLPEAVINYLISITVKTPERIFTLQEALKWFDLSNISKEDVSFDIDKLRLINAEHLKRLDSKELSRYVGFADEDIGEIAKIYLNKLSTLKELRLKIEPIFAPKTIPKKFIKEINIIRKAIKEAPHIEEFDDFRHYIIQATKLEGDSIKSLLQLLLTGVEDGADVSSLYPYLKNYLEEIIK